MRGAIFCIVSAFHAFLGNGNTPEKQWLFIDSSFFYSSFALPIMVSHRGSSHSSQWQKKSHDL